MKELGEIEVILQAPCCVPTQEGTATPHATIRPTLATFSPLFSVSLMLEITSMLLALSYDLLSIIFFCMLLLL